MAPYAIFGGDTTLLEKKIARLIILDKGPFTNYVDQFLTYSDHLPTYRGLSWTFGALPTPCPRGHRKPDHLPPMYNMYLLLLNIRS